MRALYQPPASFDAKQRRLYRSMNCPEGHERGLRQQDAFGQAYRLGFADQNRRLRPYPTTSLAYAAYRAGCDYGLATRP
jgi:hypothetical protein